MILDRPILVLNKSWYPIDSTSVRNGFCNIMTRKAYFLLTPDYEVQVNKTTVDRFDFKGWMRLPVMKDEACIRSKQGLIKIPEIMLLTDYNKIPLRTVIFCRRNLWRRDHRVCFVPETLILMADGDLKRIDSIQENDKVLDFEGNVQTVEYVFSKYTNEDLVSLHHRGNGDYLTCTPNHKILISDKKLGAKWVRAKDVTFNDYLCELNLNQRIASKAHDDIDLNIFCDSLKYLKCSEAYVRNYNGKPVYRYISVDEKLGRFVGYFLAEGNLYNNQVTFFFHLDEREFVDDLKNIVNSIFGIEITSKKIPAKYLQQVFCYSSVIAEFVRKWCFCNSEKRASAKNLPVAYLKGVLYGIMRGDGTFNKEQYRATLMLSKENLVRDIYLISHICGLRATLSKTGHRKDGRIYKSVIYNAQEFNKIVDICKVKKRLYDKNSKIDHLFNDTRFISKIKSITNMSYKGLVYDLQISGTHTYVANFVCVHNCQYCGKEPPMDEITIDHIIPKSKGGKSVFENCVLSCIECNLKKGNKSLEQCGMRLRRRKKLSNGKWTFVYYDHPKRPIWDPLYALRQKTFPKSWKCFLNNFDEDLYWEVELKT